MLMHNPASNLMALTTVSSGPASTTWGLSDVPDRSWALLGLATVGLSSCLGNFWASAGVARMGGCWEIFFYIWEAIQDCVLQPLWCWDINLSLPLSLSLSLSLSLFLSLSLSLWVSLNWWSGTERKWLVRMPSRTSNGGGWGGGGAHSPLRQVLIESRLAGYLPQACIS